MRTLNILVLLLPALVECGFEFKPPAGTPNTVPEKFDLDTGIAPIQVVAQVRKAVRNKSPTLTADATIITRITSLFSIAFFDAIVPYSDRFRRGVHANLKKRPKEEWTTRNKNVAVFYCALRVLERLLPEQKRFFEKPLKVLNFDTDDHREDPDETDAAIATGNACGRAINKAADQDGMNFNGDMGTDASPYNRKQYKDYTGYKPVNTHDRIVSPSRWQPGIVTDNGIFSIQEFVTPHHGRTKAYSFSNVRRFQTKPHGRLVTCSSLYKSTTDEVIKASATLTDWQKMAAEFFNSKVDSIGGPVFLSIKARNMTYEDFILYELVTNVAIFDVTIPVWAEKRRWDAVRPFTAAAYLYGGSKLTAYGGRGKGTVEDIPAEDWRGYMPSANHPEYPSATAAMCAAYATASKLWFNDKNTLLKPIVFKRGISGREPGITPAKDTTLELPTWDEYEKICGTTRLWGGVHFSDAIEEGKKIGRQVGELAVKFVKSLINPQKKA